MLFQALAEQSGASEILSLVLFGEETTFTVEAVPVMEWARKGDPSRICGNQSKGGLRVFFSLMRQMVSFFVSENIGTSDEKLLEEQLLSLLSGFDKKDGTNSRMLLIFNNASRYHGAPTKLVEGSHYYPPMTPKQGDFWNGEVGMEPLNAVGH